MTISREQSNRKRRELIFHTAIKCFASRGFHQTSIRDIAEKAGVSLGNLYNHYNGKDALIAEIARSEIKSLELFESILEMNEDIKVVLERFINAYLDEISQPLYMALATEIASEALRNQEVARLFNNNRERLLRALRHFLENKSKRGLSSDILEFETIAKIILDSAEGLAFESALVEKKIVKKARQSLISNLLKLVAP